ncbi:thymidine phosphorylase [Hasllibacter halocynthiae]|uniref:thymidine phosphorylase n=1 Tax=Hasllibacter halocynthiae TaxID=595589 RepID=A0A2T0X6F5_9RHOB|nr:thymidine phosphorylase [Hasllibacter halocynthiae]PRY94507.1 thymidine phosphorylase [Hasllibacter halocynthiae]
MPELRPAAMLRAMRMGERPVSGDLRAFALGIANGSVSLEQAAAFAMAVCMGPGLGEGGRVALTEAMRDGGAVLDWQLDGPVLDKHSTGGVGDCVSLILAPALAACGAYVPMISGRGLGHTGGTLDKLEAIPGLSVAGDVSRLRRVTGKVGCAIMGASERVAPADRILYSVRDVTGTVESLDLIVASILSKKLAAGLDALVLDVKCGTGAFNPDMEAAHALAEALVYTANGAGLRSVALVTAMDEPLAPAMGNAVEVMAAMEVLTEDTGCDLSEVTCELGGALLALGGLVPDAEDGADRIAGALADGRAAEVFGRMVAAQGGPGDFAHRWRDRLPGPKFVVEVGAPRAGVLASVDGRALGEAVAALGGGRQRPGDRVDPSVGLTGIARIGDRVEAGQPLAAIHAASEDDARAAAVAVLGAMRVADRAEASPPLVLGRVR